MTWTRRSLALLFPALAAARPRPQSATERNVAPSRAYPFEQLTGRQTETIKSYQILTGDTHSGYRLDLHESELPGGASPHPPHKHVHEEMLFIRDGKMEVTINGQATLLGPGSSPISLRMTCTDIAIQVRLRRSISCWRWVLTKRAGAIGLCLAARDIGIHHEPRRTAQNLFPALFGTGGVGDQPSATRGGCPAGRPPRRSKPQKLCRDPDEAACLARRRHRAVPR